MNINVKYGDIWEIDNHKIVCFDSSNENLYPLLFADSRWDMILTDPPYGISYNSKNKFLNKFNKGNHVQDDIINDDSLPLEIISEVFKHSKTYASKYNTVYIFILGKEIHKVIQSFVNQGYNFSQLLIWNKNNIILSRTDYYSKHEYIIYGWYKQHRYYGKKHYPTVLDFDKNMQNKLHPTQKPIDILKLFIKNGSPPDGVIFDPFVGSGSTLMSVEYLNRQNDLFGSRAKRKAFLVEITPHYTEVTIKRYIKSFKNYKLNYIGNICENNKEVCR